MWELKNMRLIEINPQVKKESWRNFEVPLSMKIVFIPMLEAEINLR